MSTNRIAHDTAYACASVILDSVAHLIHPGEHKEAHALWYEAIRAALIAYDAARIKEDKRLCKPSPN